jgi:acetyl esterase/lipase
LSRFAATGTLALLLSLGGDRAEALYDVSPGEIPGKPGTIIRVWPLEGGGPGMGGNGEAFRVLYRSTDPSGKPIAVSGAIYIPSGQAPAGGRNIIAWAHPTSGVMPPCAPTLMPDVGGMMWNLPNMIAQDYIVVATDYPGLGTDGVHPYLIGESEARSVLDSVRMARALPRTGASNRFAVWGHSQGGHAALYTGEIAARYAPELKLFGVAAAAPATYLVELFDDDESTEQDLLAMTVLSWTRLKGVPVASLVEPQDMAAFERTAKDCLESVAEFEKIESDESPLKRGQFLKVDPSKTEPWKGIMVHNTPGQARAGAPVFSAQGTADTTVDPALTKRFAKALCAHGVPVSFVSLPGVTHTFAARDSASAALQWMTDRFRGAPPHSDCVR